MYRLQLNTIFDAELLHKMEREWIQEHYGARALLLISQRILTLDLEHERIMCMCTY